MYDKLKKIISERLGVDESTITPLSNITEDLGADSLDLVELIMAIEEGFSTDTLKLEISDEDVRRLKTVNDVMTYLSKAGVE